MLNPILRFKRYRNSNQFFFTRDNSDEYNNEFIKVGEYTYGAPRIIGANRNSLRIGKYCSIANNVVIVLANHKTNLISNYPFLNISNSGPISNLVDDFHASHKGPVEIGNDVWLGEGCMILPNVKIGNGAVVGAGCIVRKDVAAYSIVIGDPQVEIKKRFSDDIVSDLEELKWWDLPREVLESNVGLFIRPIEESILMLRKIREK
jgi:acetyltransferase-like isoleucine patch superfamily enzyme